MSDLELKKIKIAFLGGATNSAVGSAHYSALRLDGRYNLIAGCFSRNKDENELSAKIYGVSKERVYDSLDDLLSKENKIIDAIILLTPTDQHSSQVLRCINAGFPVICEKALANNVNEAHQIKEAIKNNNGFLAVIYNYLGFPMLRELKYMIEKGKLGKIQHIEIEMPQESFIRKTENGESVIPQDWRLRDGIIPTISLDLGVHLHMIIKYLIGETPVNVVGKCNTYGNFKNIIDNVSCLIEYTNNITCNMWYSKIALGNRNGLKIRIYGERESVEWVQEKPEYLYCANSQGMRWVVDRGNIGVKVSNQDRYTRFKAGHPAGFIEAFSNYYNDIADSLILYLEGKDYSNTNSFGINESLEGLQLLEAITRSSSSRSWEKLG